MSFRSGRLWLLLLVPGLLLLPGVAAAQSLTIDLGPQGASLSGRVIQLVALIAVLSVAPGLLIMATCFTRLVVVLSLVRSALGLQQTPPNMVLVSLAMFLTYFIMQPVFEQAWDEGLRPLIDQEISEEEAFDRTVDPFRGFMEANVRDKDLAFFRDLEGKSARAVPGPADAAPAGAEDRPSLRALVPAFMLSELRRAFEIGFLLFIPFLVIDIVVSAILMSMGMMMLPPVMISLPLKLVFFILVDGWHLIASSLVRSYLG
ncbi:flagellar type III secretion system pore protein FliP [Inquilinus limosus]|uniref:flagellar type III secretion system pore protein FliP n=1 Tax=Inquilinus limosus TaxID=171674 RepID=UPI0003FBB140|nr:flagellar type III secretion system pore protein FliP [Inquilinus limosus]